MSQVLERKPTEYRVPVRRRRHVIDYTLIVIGAVITLMGVYFQFAPSDWWLAHFSEAYHLGSYALGGLVLAAGLGLYADHAMDEDGPGSSRATTATVLAAIAVLGAIIAALVWTF